MNMNVRVTRANINHGEQSQPNNCPIARALKNRFKSKLTKVSVLADSAIVELRENNKTAVYKSQMPSEGTKFVKTFDRGLPVIPLTLALAFKKTNRNQLYSI
jgi:ribosomal protein S8E